MNGDQPYKLALVEWSYLLEDFLDNIGLTLEDYLQKMTGGWLFGYIEALKTAGVETVLFCFSARVRTVKEYVHGPTGAKICVLPASAVYRLIRKTIVNPYTSNVDEAVRNAKGWKRPWYALLLHASSYFATPLTPLYRQLKTGGFHAVLCQDYEHARFDVCVALGKLLALPVFASFQGGNWQISRAEKWIRPLSLKNSKGLIVASEVEATRLKGKYGISDGKYRKIFNPVDVSVWQGVSKKEARAALGLSANLRVVVWHGRIDYHRKGLDILMDAWEKITAENKEAEYRLCLCGSGVNDALLKERIRISPARNIHWISGYTNDRKSLLCLLKAADVYVFPSRNEGFPVAPLEAMACGLPVVATDAPGITDILVDGEESGGLLVPREDSDALAKSLLLLLSRKEYSEALGRNAAKRIQENFSPEVIGSRLKEFIFQQ